MTDKKTIVRKLSRDYGLNQEVVATVFDGIFDSIKLALIRGETLQLRGFGTFECKTRAARAGYNMHTKEPLQISAYKTVGFKVSNDLKEFLNATEL